MAFENSQAFTLEGKKIILSDQFQSTTRLEVPNEKPLKKVLSINANVKITGQEKVSDGIEFSGKCTYHVVYETEENGFAALNAVTDWQQKLDAIETESFTITAEVAENVITGMSASELALSSLINVSVVGITADKIYAADGMGFDYVKSEKTYEYQKAVNFVSESFNEVADMQVSGKIDEILTYFGDVRLKDVISGIDMLTLEGEIFINTSYVVGGEVVNQVKTIDFKREIAALSTVPNNFIDANVALNGLIVTASVSEIDNNSTLVFSAELKADAAIYSRDNLTVVEDMFSLTKEINAQYQCLASCVYEGEQNFQDNQVLTLPLNNDADDILYVSGVKAAVNDVITAENGVLLNGCLVTDVVLKDQSDEKIIINGMAPFTIELTDVSADQDFKVKAKLLSYKLKSQNEVSLSVEFYITSKKVKNEYITYISSAEECEDKVPNDCAVRVYVAGKNERLFDIAKKINVRPDDIIAQNQGAENGIDEGARLVIYNPLNLNF